MWVMLMRLRLWRWCLAEIIAVIHEPIWIGKNFAITMCGCPPISYGIANRKINFLAKVCQFYEFSLYVVRTYSCGRIESSSTVLTDAYCYSITHSRSAIAAGAVQRLSFYLHSVVMRCSPRISPRTDPLPHLHR